MLNMPNGLLPRKEMAAAADDPAKVWALADLVKRGESVYAANCRPVTRPMARALAPSNHWMVLPWCWPTRMPSLSASCSKAWLARPCLPGRN